MVNLRILKKCNHENAVVPLRLGYNQIEKQIVVGFFCLKCGKFWLRKDYKECLKRFKEFEDVI